MTCEWCGYEHATDRLCERAQRGLTRRSFCFLFGAGVGLALAGGASAEDFVLGVKRSGEMTFPINPVTVKPQAYVDVVIQIAGQFGIDLKGELEQFGVGSLVSFRTNAPIDHLVVGKNVKIDGVGRIAPASDFSDPIVGYVVSATLVDKK